MNRYEIALKKQPDLWVEIYDYGKRIPIAEKNNIMPHEKILNFFGWCGYCRRFFHYPKKRRMNTQYADEESNWIYCCREQYDEVQEQWKEDWQDYYSGLF